MVVLVTIHISKHFSNLEIYLSKILISSFDYRRLSQAEILYIDTYTLINIHKYLYY